MQKLNLKTTGLSIVLLFVMMTPATIVHEVGHSAVCTAYGYNTNIKIDTMSATSFCYSDEIKGNYFYYAFGGLSAFIVLMVPLMLPKIRNTQWIFVPLLTLAISHGLNSAIETLAYDYYITDNSVLPSVLMVVSLGIFFTLLIKYGRIKDTQTVKLVKRQKPTLPELESKKEELT